MYVSLQEMNVDPIVCPFSFLPYWEALDTAVSG